MCNNTTVQQIVEPSSFLFRLEGFYYFCCLETPVKLNKIGKVTLRNICVTVTVVEELKY
jgi:hypothetical protein